jgi:WhiB family redox-sensing transcriptional regulator
MRTPKPSIAAWRFQAACGDVDPDLFFPIGGKHERELQARAAKAVCSQCPVATTCLSAAFDLGIDDGIWGGLSAPERDRLRVIARAG